MPNPDCRKSAPQDVKIRCGRVEETQSETEPQIARGLPPVGLDENLVVGPRFQVKRIHVN
jgi:hypothetical protein